MNISLQSKYLAWFALVFIFREFNLCTFVGQSKVAREKDSKTVREMTSERYRQQSASKRDSTQMFLELPFSLLMRWNKRFMWIFAQEILLLIAERRVL